MVGQRILVSSALLHFHVQQLQATNHDFQKIDSHFFLPLKYYCFLFSMVQRKCKSRAEFAKLAWAIMPRCRFPYAKLRQENIAGNRKIVSVNVCARLCTFAWIFAWIFVWIFDWKHKKGVKHIEVILSRHVASPMTNNNDSSRPGSIYHAQSNERVQ